MTMHICIDELLIAFAVLPGIRLVLSWGLSLLKLTVNSSLN
jgi:hypothetical protein